MIADAPLATVNSGGVDSSLISAIAHQLNPQITLYHVDVVGPRTSELAAARRTAEHVKGDLRVVDLDDRRWLQKVVRTVYYQEIPPWYHPNSVAFLALCEQIGKDGVKGILSGEGADEIFLGYPRLVLFPYLEALRRVPVPVRYCLSAVPSLRSLLCPAPEPSLARRLDSRCMFAEEQAEMTERLSFIGDRKERAYYRQTMNYLRHHLLSVLHRNDRMGMASGIESRFPFLYSPLVRFGLNLPVRHRIRLEPRVVNARHPFLVDKAPLRHYAVRHLPKDIAFRRKLGFPIQQQQRLMFGADFLRKGFVEDQFQMGNSQIADFVAGLNGADRAMVFFLEIWGRLFILRGQVAEVEAHVAETSSLR
jgi:asparagine synthase (glutamine-hydrolysing)